MKKPHNLYTLAHLVKRAEHVQEQYKPGKWRPVMPWRYRSRLNDLRLAWLVFTRKADAFVWPEQEDALIVDN